MKNLAINEFYLYDAYFGQAAYRLMYLPEKQRRK